MKSLQFSCNLDCYLLLNFRRSSFKRSLLPSVATSARFVAGGVLSLACCDRKIDVGLFRSCNRSERTTQSQRRDPLVSSSLVCPLSQLNLPPPLLPSPCLPGSVLNEILPMNTSHFVRVTTYTALIRAAPVTSLGQKKVI